MKQIIYKSLFLLCFLMASMINVKAQETLPATFVKINPELNGFNPSQMSDNGRYIVCNNGNATLNNTAKLWDTETDMVTEIGKKCWAYDVSNDGKIIVGQYLDDKILYPGVYKDGKWNKVDLYPGFGVEKGSQGGSIHSVSPDGKIFGGHLSYMKGPNIKPVIWDENGKYVRCFDIANVENYTDYRAGMRAMSNDGTKVAGWSERVGDNYFNGYWIPSFWNKLEGDPIPVIVANGYLQGMDNNGTMAVGHTGQVGVVVKDDGTIIQMGSDFVDVSETGLIVGMEMYTEKLGLMTLDFFFREMYGLEIENMHFVQAVSDNGEFMAIRLMTGIAYVRVSGDPLPTAAHHLSLISGEKSSVYISWEKPAFNGFEPIGYNVYRNGSGEKINTELITELSFQDKTPPTGKNCYTVKAVYKYHESSEELISEACESKCIEVVDENGCLSPKHLVADVVYNRTVNLEWQRPLPNYNKSSAVKTEEEVEPVKIKPNLLKTLNVGSSIGVASDGKNIFTVTTEQTGVMSTKFQKYTLDGEHLEDFAISKRSFFNGLTFDGNNFYTTVGSLSCKINAMKTNGGVTPIAQDIVGNILRICYLPFLDDNKGGFEIGLFKDKKTNTEGKSAFITKDGVKIEGGGIPPYDEAIMGIAYHNDVMYVAKRTGDDGKGMEIQLYDPTTLKPTGEYIDLKDYTNIQNIPSSQLWGISIMKSSEGIPCLTAIISPGTVMMPNKLVFLELGDMEGLKGYNVYRNDAKITAEPIKTTSFSEKIMEAGDYKYEVEAVYDNDCISSKTESVNVKIAAIGEVNAPKNASAEAVRNNAIISWEAPKAAAGPKVVGYNVFRDGKQLNEEGKYVTNLFYVDKDLAFGTYTYTVNAFYNNSGESAKVETTLTINGFNPTLPPTDLKLSEKSRGNISLDWKVPALGDYEVMSWNNGAIEGGVGLNDGGVFYVASKWNPEDLGMVFDYTLTDIEFYSYIDVPHTFYVYVDGVKVATQNMESVTPFVYSILKLDTPITVQKGKSLMVSYMVNHAKGERPVGSDYRANVIGKGDLMSTDGENWESCSVHGLRANWAISLRFMPYSVGTPTKIEDIKMAVNESGNIKLVTSEAVRNASEPIFKNAEVTGYNVYKNDTKINTTNIVTTSFEDTSADLTKNNCYTVEALFTADRVSPKSEDVCSFGHCLVPTFSAKRNTTSNLPELKMSVPTTVVADKTDIKYYDEEAFRPTVMSTDFGFAAFLQLKPIDLVGLDGYTITHINAYFYSIDCEVALYAMEDGIEVLNKPVDKKSFKVGMNKFLLEDPFTINEEKTLWIGLKITTKARVETIGIDAGPGDSFRGDVIMTDGKSIRTLKSGTGGAVDANWNLSLSLEKTAPLTEKLEGYNIYRDGVKINDAAITEKVYIDETAEVSKSYTYHTTALWNTNCESEASEKIEVKALDGVNDIAGTNMKIYPNPAKDILNIEGEYETVRLYNSVGQECFMQNAEGGKLSINVSNWAKGIYVVEATSANGEVNRGKVIIK